MRGDYHAFVRHHKIYSINDRQWMRIMQRIPNVEKALANYQWLNQHCHYYKSSYLLNQQVLKYNSLDKSWYYYDRQSASYKLVYNRGTPCNSSLTNEAPSNIYETGSYEAYWFYLLKYMIEWNNTSWYVSCIEKYALEDVDIDWQGLLDIASHGLLDVDSYVKGEEHHIHYDDTIISHLKLMISKSQLRPSIDDR